MIYNEEAYYTGYYRNVREIKAVPALVFDTIVGLLRDPNNKTGEIANKTLQDMLGVSKQTVLDAINKIIEFGWIVRTNGDGRGNKSVYALTEKGLKNVPFIDKKGSKNWTERVKKIDYKGQEIRPINKELNKELKESGDDMHASAQSHALSNTTPQNFENMEDFNFNLWFELFTDRSEWQHEKENCERVWFAMSQQWRDNLVQMAQKGLRWRKRENDNPYWYLKNYNGEVAQVELPYFRQGTKKFEDWYNNNRLTRTKMVLMRYREPGDRDDAPTLAYCLATDMQTMMDAGAEFVGYVN